MVIDWAIDELGINQKPLSIKKIADTIGWDEAKGTSPERIEDVNQLLRGSFAQFKKVEPATFILIEQEIEPKTGKPKLVIAWTNVIDDNDGVPWHAVIINGYSEDKREINYIDPLIEEQYSQKNCEMGTFLQKRLGNSGKLITLVIKEEGQTDLLGNVFPVKRKRRSKKK